MNEKPDRAKRIPDPPQENCTNCRFSGDKNGTLVCRKTPGTPALVMGMGAGGIPAPSSVMIWGPVESYDWCGEHEPKLNG